MKKFFPLIGFFFFIFLVSVQSSPTINEGEEDEKFMSQCNTKESKTESDCVNMVDNGFANNHTSNNYYCCLAKYKVKAEEVIHCSTVWKTEEGLKEKIDEYKDKGGKSVKILCGSSYIKEPLVFVLLIIFSLL